MQTVGVLNNILKTNKADIIEGKLGLLQYIRQGVPTFKVKVVQNRMGITKQRIASLLDVNVRTLQRYKPDQRLNSSISEKVAYLEQLQDLGREVFETDERFAQWLNEDLPTLNEQKPFAYLDTITGIDAVRQVLLRYQHGIF